MTTKTDLCPHCGIDLAVELEVFPGLKKGEHSCAGTAPFNCPLRRPLAQDCPLCDWPVCRAKPGDRCER